ncbi:MAG TPA: glutamine-hydrolyzing carbamoyl-phosphate synthase small subunit [Anaerolineae bacterium]|nr:glutamine-hydrolyzing carbamoyl-phosphate synthase small subunit [Anaerolineae bacterium]HQH39658.1 glutamine-hydrolyzing carbamoyl-phosphate synthase small subunit [Anaerolineae bacterium]
MKIGAKPALLALEDGTRFWGNNIGAEGETFGEFVFNTGMTGYQEVLTDPSYCGQIVVMTYPEIGIYGVNPEDVESGKVQVAGFVVHRAARGMYNHRATLSFLDYLAQANIVAIEGVDTRALTRHLRTHGVQRGAISAVDLDPASLIARVRQSPQMAGSNLAERVQNQRISASANRRENASRITHHVSHIVLIDCGFKANMERELAARGAAVTVVPYDADLPTVLALKPDGVLVSNGPGDPEPLHATMALLRGLLEQHVPLAGICLGHQLLGLALGGKTYKMRFGHRGANHPVKDFTTGRILITTQNHGFAVDPASLGIAWTPLEREPRIKNQESRISESANERMGESASGRISESRITMAEMLPIEMLVGESPLGFGPVEVTQLSLNDGTLEGLRLRDYPAFSVQHHPEACPGPHDANGFFEEFLAMVGEDFTAECAENAKS